MLELDISDTALCRMKVISESQLLLWMRKWCVLLIYEYASKETVCIGVKYLSALQAELNWRNRDEIPL